MSLCFIRHLHSHLQINPSFGWARACSQLNGIMASESELVAEPTMIAAENFWVSLNRARRRRWRSMSSPRQWPRLSRFPKPLSKKQKRNKDHSKPEEQEEAEKFFLWSQKNGLSHRELLQTSLTAAPLRRCKPRVSAWQVSCIQMRPEPQALDQDDGSWAEGKRVDGAFYFRWCG